MLVFAALTAVSVLPSLCHLLPFHPSYALGLWTNITLGGGKFFSQQSITKVYRSLWWCNRSHFDKSLFCQGVNIVSCIWLKEQRMFSPNLMFFSFMCRLYLKWSKFLCNFNACGSIKTTCTKTISFPLPMLSLYDSTIACAEWHQTWLGVNVL